MRSLKQTLDFLPCQVVRQRLQEVGGRMAGTLAMDSCRLEKAYRHFGHDIAGDDHVLEAGLGFAVKTDKRASIFGAFIGRDAVLQKRETGATKRLLQLRLTDPAPLLYHNEPIIRDGAIAGYVTSGGYGHHLGASVGLGFVACQPFESDADILRSRYLVEVAGTVREAQASLTAFYDPASKRMRL